MVVYSAIGLRHRRTDEWRRYELEWRLGDKGFAYDTQRQDSIGIGLRFANF